MKLKEIPYEGSRVESGPVRIGDDWPGTYIRGDEAYYYAHALERGLTDPDLIDKMMLTNLIVHLRSSNQENL
jgi:hypothetical protein